MCNSSKFLQPVSQSASRHDFRKAERLLRLRQSGSLLHLVRAD
jgi:hypothetical protein